MSAKCQVYYAHPYTPTAFDLVFGRRVARFASAHEAISHDWAMVGRDIRCAMQRWLSQHETHETKTTVAAEIERRSSR